MNSETFKEIYSKWKNKTSGGKFWGELASTYGYSSGEAARSSFKRARRLYSGKEISNIKEVKSGARILLFDIETSPLNVLAWGIWEQNINIEAILQDWHIMSWSAKWLFDENEMFDVLTPKEAKEHNDKRICDSIWKLLDQADITVAHNGDKFDHKKLNTRFLYHGFKPLSHYKSIDTLIVAKNNFSFTSNRLDYITSFLGIPTKTKTDFDLWKRAYFGEEKALKELAEYNKNDTFVLEELFVKLRPFIKNFPNLNLYNDDNTSVCRNCGSDDISWGGYYYTNVSRYKGWRCNNCGAIGRSRFSDLKKEKNKSVLV